MSGSEERDQFWGSCLCGDETDGSELGTYYMVADRCRVVPRDVVKVGYYGIELRPIKEREGGYNPADHPNIYRVDSMWRRVYDRYKSTREDIRDKGDDD